MEKLIPIDAAMRDWMLFPIMIVMFLVGLVRHFVTQAMASTPELAQKAVRESAALVAMKRLRASAALLPPLAFQDRLRHWTEAVEKGAYLKAPAGEAAAPTDPMQMAGVMDGLKNNMAMVVPQTLIMSWITFFFSGFVLLRLPFPLTVRFKDMLQRGIMTPDLDVRYVSSLSWYFLNLFGLRPIFTLLLGEGSAADGLRDMQAMHTLPAMGPGSDPSKLFQSELDGLRVHHHEFGLATIEADLLRVHGKAAGDKKRD